MGVIDIRECRDDISRAVQKFFTIPETDINNDLGDTLITEFAKDYLRALNLNLHTHGEVDLAKLSSQFASAMHAQSFVSAYITMKDWSDKIVACQQVPDDRDPAPALAEALYRFESFIEEAFESLEALFDTLSEAFKTSINMITVLDASNKKANGYFLRIVPVISDTSIVRKHCESQAVFKKLITEIIMSD